MYFIPFLQNRHWVFSRAPGVPKRLLLACRLWPKPEFLLSVFLFNVFGIFYLHFLLRQNSVSGDLTCRQP